MTGLFRLLICLVIVSPISTYAKKIDVSLGSITLLKDQATIKIPSHFTALLEYENKLHYEGQKNLKIAYGDSLRETRLAFFVDRYDEMKDPGLGALKAEVLNGFLKSDLKLKELSNGIVSVDGRDMAYLGILHKSPEKFYRFYFLTVYNKLVLSGELICPKKVHKSWIPVGEEIMKSLKIKEN